MASPSRWTSIPRRDSTSSSSSHSLDSLAQQQPEQAKPEPKAKVRSLKEKQSLPSFFMSPTATWNLYRHNPWYLSWQQETWAMIFSLACLIAVAVIMAWVDGKRLSIWHWAIQPNAVISVLIVSSKAALMISTASCVSQLKWTHFQQKPRTLKDLEGFDDASRGAYGSLCLLMSRSGYLNIAVTLGCAVTVLVLAMETFGQQLLSFPEKTVAVANETASFPVLQDLLQMPYWGAFTERPRPRLSIALHPHALGIATSLWGCVRAVGISVWTQTYNHTSLICDYVGDGDKLHAGSRNLTTIRHQKSDQVLNPDIPDPNNASAWTYDTAIDIMAWNDEGFYYKDHYLYPANFNDGKLGKYNLGYDSVQLHDSGHGLPNSMAYTNYTFRANGTGFPSDKHNDTFKVYYPQGVNLQLHLRVWLRCIFSGSR
ncbi:hypothetical protein KCV07_g456, partial [Aureobasidium melanogenum]